MPDREAGVPAGAFGWFWFRGHRRLGWIENGGKVICGVIRWQGCLPLSVPHVDESAVLFAGSPCREFRPTPGQWILSVRLTSIFRTGLFAILVVLCDRPSGRLHFRVLDRMHADGFASPFEKIDWSKRRLVTCRTIPQRLFSETSQTRIARLRRCVAWRSLRRKRFDSLCFFSDLAKRVALRQGLRRSGCCARPSTRLMTS